MIVLFVVVGFLVWEVAVVMSVLVVVVGGVFS